MNNQYRFLHQVFKNYQSSNLDLLKYLAPLKIKIKSEYKFNINVIYYKSFILVTFYNNLSKNKK